GAALLERKLGADVPARARLLELEAAHLAIPSRRDDATFERRAVDEAPIGGDQLGDDRELPVLDAVIDAVEGALLGSRHPPHELRPVRAVPLPARPLASPPPARIRRERDDLAERIGPGGEERVVDRSLGGRGSHEDELRSRARRGEDVAVEPGQALDAAEDVVARAQGRLERLLADERFSDDARLAKEDLRKLLRAAKEMKASTGARRELLHV